MKGEVVQRSKRVASVKLFCDQEEGNPRHCGACSMGQAQPASEVVFAHNDVGADVGEIVECRVEEAGRLKAAITLLLVPLLVFLVAAGTLTSFDLSLAITFSVSLMTTGLSLFVIKQILAGKTYYHIVSRHCVAE